MIEQTRRLYSRTLSWATLTLVVGAAGAGCYKAATGTRPGAPASAVALAGVTGYPETNKQFQDYFLSLAYADDADPDDIIREHAFTCSKPAECGGKTSVRIRIVPTRVAHTVNWKGALGTGTGHLVAKIVILDPRVPVGPLGLAADETGYLWVGENPGGGPRAPAVYPITNSGVVGKPEKLKDKGYCDDGANKWPAVHINPGVCGTGLKPFYVRAATSESPADPLQLATTPYRKPDTRLAGGSGDDPTMEGEDLWVSCRNGCCRVLLE